MKKFFILIKKETLELITIQIIAPMLITIGLFMAIGTILDKESEKAKTPQKLIIQDQDSSILSKRIQLFLEEANFDTINAQENEQNIIEFAQSHKAKIILQIPKEFQDSIDQVAPKEIKITILLDSISTSTIGKVGTVKTISSAINTIVAQKLINENSKNPNLANININAPVPINENVWANQKNVQANPETLLIFVSQQTAFIPIILFIVILFASQMIATTIANEKENKTLETLLSLPIKREFIVAAKMIGAGIVSAISAGIYMFGFNFYMKKLMSGDNSSAQSALANSVRELGLKFSNYDYVLLGLSLFFGILAALAISIIIGAFANDIKSVQGLITPLMILITIPYIVSIFLDLNTVSPIVKYLIYAIPFSHPFLASSYLFFDQYQPVIFGIIYQFVFFVIFVYIGARIFSSDKLITLKLNFSKKFKINQ